MLRASARLHRDNAGSVVGEVLQELRPRQLHFHDLACLHVDPVQLENALCGIHTNYGFVNLHLGPSGLPVNSLLFTTWHSDAVGPRGSNPSYRTSLAIEHQRLGGVHTISKVIRAPRVFT